MTSDGEQPPVFNANATVTVEDKLASALWFDADAFTKRISVPNLLVGGLLGAVLAVTALLTPFVLSSDSDGFGEPPAEYLVRSTVATEAPIPAETAIARSVELFEDILTDLHVGFVDPINPQKLFETAVRVRPWQASYPFRFQYAP